MRRISEARIALAAVALLAACAASAQVNPLARGGAPSAASLNGRWNGVDLERRSACANAQNNGDRGTYAQFDIVADASGNLAVTQSGITGLNCTYAGRYQLADRRLAAQGTVGCSDGKQGTFESTRIAASGAMLEMRLAIRLTGGESCSIDAILALARFPG